MFRSNRDCDPIPLISLGTEFHITLKQFTSMQKFYKQTILHGYKWLRQNSHSALLKHPLPQLDVELVSW
jgi:hypothetical protein